MRVKVFAVPSLLLLLLAGCSSGTPKASGSNLPTTTASGSIQASPVPPAATTANPLATLNPSMPVPQDRRPCDPRIRYSAQAGVPGGNYIRAVTRGVTRWGPGCLVLNPGDKCDVQWDGAYSVLVGTEAHLVFQLWAKGQDKVFRQLSAGPLPAEYSFRRLIFPVTIPDAEEMALRIVLLDQAKRPVAIGDSYTYKINCPKGAK